MGHIPQKRKKRGSGFGPSQAQCNKADPYIEKASLHSAPNALPQILLNTS